MPKRYPEAIAHYPQSLQIFLRKIVNRIDKGKNALAVFVGETGSGKSLSSVQLILAINLYMHGKEPENEETMSQVFFKAKPFVVKMRELSKILKDQGKKKIKTKVWVWDEAGVEVSHKAHASIKNRVINWLAQTFRNLGQIVIFTVPSLSFIDSNVRKLLHIYLEAVSIDIKKKMCIVKPLEMQYNVRMDKIYYHYFKYPTNDGMIEIDFMGVPKVSDELEDLYEQKKNEFTDNLNKQIIEILDKLDADESTSESVYDKLTDRQRNIFDLIVRGITKTGDIAKEMNIRPSAVSENLGFMRNKGVNTAKMRRKMPILDALPQKTPARI